MYEYAARLIRVIDGDTVQLDIDLGLNIHRVETVRLYGINTPELRSSDASERSKAVAAKLFVETALTGQPLLVRTSKPYPTDKYGRYLASISYPASGGSDGQLVDLTSTLLEEGLGVQYFGGAK